MAKLTKDDLKLLKHSFDSILESLEILDQIIYNRDDIKVINCFNNLGHIKSDILQKRSMLNNNLHIEGIYTKLKVSHTNHNNYLTSSNVDFTEFEKICDFIFNHELCKNYRIIYDLDNVNTLFLAYQQKYTNLNLKTYDFIIICKYINTCNFEDYNKNYLKYFTYFEYMGELI